MPRTGFQCFLWRNSNDNARSRCCGSTETLVWFFAQFFCQRSSWPTNPPSLDFIHALQFTTVKVLFVFHQGNEKVSDRNHSTGLFESNGCVWCCKMSRRQMKPFLAETTETGQIFPISFASRQLTCSTFEYYCLTNICAILVLRIGQNMSLCSTIFLAFKLKATEIQICLSRTAGKSSMLYFMTKEVFKSRLNYRKPDRKVKQKCFPKLNCRIFFREHSMQQETL